MPLDQITCIDLHLPDFHAAILPFGQPRSRAEALFSLPFVVSMGLARGALTIADLEEGAWDRTEITGLIGKVRVHPFKPARPDLNYSVEDPDRLVLTLADGRRVEKTCVYPLGAPQVPLTLAQLWAKFDANTGGRVGRARTARLTRWAQEAGAACLLTEEGPE
jgi:2-methylcitrate dehydratase PrpD